MAEMPCVIIESPFRGNLKAVPYLHACLLDALGRGESPYASHIFIPQVLDDSIEEDREKGIRAGYAWWSKADLIAFYIDMGWSDGMKRARIRAESLGKRFEIRSIHW